MIHVVDYFELLCTVCPMKYAHIYCALLCYQFLLLYVIHLPTFFRDDSLLSRQSYGISRAIGEVLRGMGKIDWYQNTPKHRTPNSLTHSGQVTHICVGNLTIIGSDNGLAPGRRQAIISTNAWILSTGPSGTNFNEFKHFHSRKCTSKCRLRSGVYFISASMC